MGWPIFINVSAGRDLAQFWVNPFFPMFLLGWTWARFGLSHFYQCFSWARHGLDKAQFWANPFLPMFLLGWAWARFGLSHFFQCFSWTRLELDKVQFWAKPFYQCVCLLGLGLSVAVLRTCVEDEALGGLMSPRLNSDLDSWPLDHQCQCWNAGWRICLLSSWRKKRMICNSCFGS